MIYPKIYYTFLFYEKLVNTLHECIEKNPHVIQYQNVSYSLFVKINGTIVKKQKHLVIIPERELQNYMILTVSQGGFFGAVN